MLKLYHKQFVTFITRVQSNVIDRKTFVTIIKRKIKMNEGAIAVFIPIIVTLVTGAILIVYFYLKSKEKQMLIEKGLSAEEIKKFFEEKRDGLTLMKIGIISIFFGLGLGIGMMLEDATTKEYWVPFSLFVGTGIGFVLSNLIANKIKTN